MAWDTSREDINVYSQGEIDKWVYSTCNICSNGCGCYIAVKDNKIVGIKGNKDYPEHSFSVWRNDSRNVYDDETNRPWSIIKIGDGRFGGGFVPTCPSCRSNFRVRRSSFHCNASLPAARRYLEITQCALICCRLYLKK